jgi:hypothetical protein
MKLHTQFFLFFVHFIAYVQILPTAQCFHTSPQSMPPIPPPPTVMAQQPLVGQGLLPIETFTNTLRHTTLGRIPLDE